MPPHKGASFNPDAVTPVALHVQVPSDIVARVDDLVERSVMGRADIIRLALSKMSDDLVPPELFASAEIVREMRRLR